MRVSINHKGRIRGMDKVLTAAMEEYAGLDCKQTDDACKVLGELLREIAELAWICRMSAEQSGRYFGYEVEVYVTETGPKWQRYRTEAVPPPPLRTLVRAGHSMAITLHAIWNEVGIGCRSRIKAWCEWLRSIKLIWKRRWWHAAAFRTVGTSQLSLPRLPLHALRLFL